MSTEWTDEEMRAQGYEVDPDHPAHLEQRGRLDRQIDANALRRESLLPCGQATGPLAEKETPAPRSEVDRLLRPGLAWKPEAKTEDHRLVRLAEE